MIRNLVYLAIFTFIIILSWIAFGIYHSYTTSTISSDTGILISPIPAHFDLDVIKNLANRKVIPVDLSGKAPAASSAAQPSPTPTPARILPTVQLTPTPSKIIPPPFSSPAASGPAQVNL